MSALDIYIYDYIGPWDDEVSASEVAAVLAAHQQVDTVRVYVNSGGGNLYEGLAIHSALERHPAQVEVLVEGVAASIASCIVQAGDVRRMAPTAQMMIHDPRGGAWGEARDLETAMRQLEAARQTLAALYMTRSGSGDIASWLAVMAAETWYTAPEAVAAGLADEVLAAPGVAAPGVFASSPRAAGPRDLRLGVRRPARAARGRGYALPSTIVAQATPTLQTHPPITMADQTTTSLMGRIKSMLGQSDDFDAVDELRQVQARAAAADAAEAQVASLRSELQQAQEALEAAQAARQSAEEALEAAEQREDERIVERAVAEFRIPAAERETRLAAMRADREGTRALLASLPAGLHNPSAAAPGAPSGTQAGAVRLTRAEARDARRYRQARNEAAERGLALEITD